MRRRIFSARSKRDIAAFRDEVRAGFSELSIAIAATRADMALVKDDVAKIAETEQIHGARLNIIDARLAMIEKHTGLVKA